MINGRRKIVTVNVIYVNLRVLIIVGFKIVGLLLTVYYLMSE
jgi:hypothetical protein